MNGTRSCPTPVLRITSAAAASALACERQARTTVAPIRASSRAVSRPMPVLAPVTMHTLPPMSTSRNLGPRTCLLNVRRQAAATAATMSACSAACSGRGAGRCAAGMASAAAASAAASTQSQPRWAGSRTSEVLSRHPATAGR